MFAVTLHQVDFTMFGNPRTKTIFEGYFGDQVEAEAFISKFSIYDNIRYTISDIGYHPDHPVEVEHQQRMLERADKQYRDYLDYHGGHDPDDKSKRRKRREVVEADNLPF